MYLKWGPELTQTIDHIYFTISGAGNVAILKTVSNERMFLKVNYIYFKTLLFETLSMSNHILLND